MTAIRTGALGAALRRKAWIRRREAGARASRGRRACVKGQGLTPLVALALLGPALGWAGPLDPFLRARVAREGGTARIHGSVQDPGGPLGGATVFATPLQRFPTADLPCFGPADEEGSSPRDFAPFLPGNWPVLARTRSAGDGSFELQGLRPGSYLLWSVGPGSMMGLPSAAYAGGPGSTVIAASPGRMLQAQVLLEGKPVPGATVTAISPQYPVAFQTSSGRNGRFEIGPLPEGSYALFATRPGRLTGQACASPGAPAPDLEVGQAFSIEGQLLEGARPVPRLHVTLAGSRGSRAALLVRETTADAYGRFRFGALPRGRYQLLAQGGNLAGWADTDVPAKRVTIALESSGLIFGVVRDESGRSMEGLEVTLARDAIRLRTRTGKDGSYAFRELPRGSYRLEVERQGFVDLSENAFLYQTQARSDLTLVRRVALRGRVREASGQPASDRQLLAFCNGRSESGDSDSSVLSGEDGTFSMDLPPGKCRVGAGPRDFWDLTVKEVTVPGSVEIVLPGRKTVQVEVVDEQGAPVPGALLEFRLERGDFQPLSGRTSRDGRATLDLRTLPKGLYTVRAMNKEGRPGPDGKPGSVSVRTAWTELVLDDRDLPPVRLTLRGALRITGKAGDAEGRPVAGAEIWALRAGMPRSVMSANVIDQMRPSPGAHIRHSVALLGSPSPGMNPEGIERLGSLAWTRTAEDGSFSLERLQPGRYVLLAEKERLRAGPVLVEAGRDRAAVLFRRRPVVRGTVRAPTGEPVSRFKLVPLDPEPRFETRTDRTAGAFELDVDRPGLLQVVISAEGYAPAFRRFEVPEGELNLPEIRLAPVRKVSLQVVDEESGRPVEGAGVYLSLSPKVNRDRELARSSQTGRILLERGVHGLPLWILHPDHVPAPVTVPEGASELTVRLKPAATLLVEVLDDGKPLPGSFKAEICSRQGCVEVPAANGPSQALKGLPEGRYTVRARALREEESPVLIPPRTVEVGRSGVVPVTLSVAREVARLQVHCEEVPEQVSLVSGKASMPGSRADLADLAVRSQRSDLRWHVHQEEVTFAAPPGDYTLFVAYPMTDGLYVFRKVLRLAAGESEVPVRYADALQVGSDPYP